MSFNDDYSGNLRELYDSASAIRESEEQDFIQKWGKVKVEVPVNYIAFDSLIEHLTQGWPDYIGMPDDKMKNRPELVEMLGPLAEPLVDYVNLYRRIDLRAQVLAYMKLGYLDVGIDEYGTTEYSIPAGVELTETLRERVIECVHAYGGFSGSS